MQRDSQFKDYGFPEVRGSNDARRRHLEFMSRLRIEAVPRNREFMGPMCCIPALDWAVIKVRFPELISADRQIQKNAWNTFMAHSASLPYRSKERRRSGTGK